MIRVLVVDDSAVLRQQLQLILRHDPEIEVVGQATNGEQAIRMAKRLAPDVITMDICMPRMDGYEAIEAIMEQHPVPIVVVTGRDVAREPDVARRAMRCGAVKVLEKPGSIKSPDFQTQASHMARQIRLMSSVKVISRRSRRPSMASKATGLAGVAHATLLPSLSHKQAGDVKILAIGSSTGGPAALHKVIGALPADLGIPVVVVQHISFGFVGGLAQWLDGGSQVTVCVPEHGDRMQPGHVYLAPDDHHMQVDRFGRIRLNEGEPIGGHRPSVTVLFNSVAESYGKSALGAILTGMGADGAKGMLALHQAGAQTVAQDQESCVVFGMPREAIALGAVDQIVPLDGMAATLMSLVTG